MVYTDITGFEWDHGKARNNARKHGIGFKTAATAFHDPDAVIADDVAHSGTERRAWLIGLSARGRVLVVVYSIRGQAIRIISARPANRREKAWYHEQSSGISF